MQKVAIYCRLSEEDRNKINPLQESESIQNQKSMLTAYAMQQGWGIYNIYCDEDYSGIDASRPEFNKLLHDAENKKFNIILCKTQSRFTRDMEAVEKYIHNKFVEWGIRFVTSVDNVDTDDKGNKKTRQINGLVNEWFLEDLSENIRSVLTNKRRQGQYIGSFFPYGYMKDISNKTKLIVDPIASQNVEQIFNWYTGGYGVTRIAQMLNEQKIPNPTAYKKQQGYPYRAAKYSMGNLWSYTTIREILRNQVYLGHMVQGKYKKISYKNQRLVRAPKEQWIVVENTHEPIIDAQLFYKVQKRLSLHAHPLKENGQISIFAGKVKCMFCGRSMHKTYSKNIPYLYCRTKEQYNHGCKGSGIPFSVLENAVLTNIQCMLNKYHTAEYLLAAIRENKKVDKKILDLETRKKSIELEIKELSGVLLSLYTDKTKGIITEQQFVKMSEGLSGKEDLLGKDLAVLAQSIEMTKQKSQQNTLLKDILNKYGKITDLNRDLIEELIDFIEVGYDELKQAKIINIHWNI